MTHGKTGTGHTVPTRVGYGAVFQSFSSMTIEETGQVNDFIVLGKGY